RSRAAARFSTRLRALFEHAPEIRPLTLRFQDASLEAEYQERYFRDSLPYLRCAHILGIVTWAAFGVLAAFVLSATAIDFTVRFGIGIPLAAAGLVLTYGRSYARHWQSVVALVLIASGVTWSTHRAIVADAR